MFPSSKTNNIQGLLHVPTKTFYYVEVGEHRCINAFDRIKKVLVARGVLTYTGASQDVFAAQLKPMGLIEAKEKQYTIEPIWLNDHVKQNNKPVETKSNTSSISWGKA